MKNILILFAVVCLTACSPNTSTPVLDQPTAIALPIMETNTAAPEAVTEPDLFSANDIVLPGPVCGGTLTSEDMEGPYYTPNTPQRNSLVEDGMQGTHIFLVGYVLDENCQPIPGAWLDFWQADSDGNYDNEGFRLRGHQVTDAQGRYILETVIPGEYGSRPIAHIHLKIQAPGGNVVTSQLYFPSQSVPGLTVTLEERSDYSVAYFNFVVNTP